MKDGVSLQNSPSAMGNLSLLSSKAGKTLSANQRDKSSGFSFALHAVEGNLLGDLIDFESFLGLQFIHKTTKPPENGAVASTL